MTLFYRFARRLTAILRGILFRVTYEGKENLPTEGGYIVVCNHRSFLDPILLSHAIPRQVYFMGKEELFHNRLLGFILGKLGVFAVNRGAGDMNVIDHAADIIKRGDLLGIFPEGTRSKDGQPLRPKSGAALVAKLSKADIIPCAILFDGKMAIGKKIRIKIGKPVPFEQLGFSDESASSLRRAAKAIMRHITDLMELEEASGEN